MSPETVETDSLRLRPVGPDYVDVFELYDLFAADGKSAAGVFEYVPMEPYETVSEARDWLEGAAAEWDDGAHAKYAVYRRGTPAGIDGSPMDTDGPLADSGTLAGTAALTPDWDRRTGRLAVILARPYWGRGTPASVRYAGECARALTRVAFERLDLELVALSYDAGNERSKRAIETFVEGVGGQDDGVVRNATPRGDDVVDAHRYTVTREAFERATADG